MCEDQPRAVPSLPLGCQRVRRHPIGLVEVTEARESNGSGRLTLSHLYPVVEARIRTDSALCVINRIFWLSERGQFGEVGKDFRANDFRLRVRRNPFGRKIHLVGLIVLEIKAVQMTHVPQGLGLPY